MDKHDNTPRDASLSLPTPVGPPDSPKPAAAAQGATLRDWLSRNSFSLVVLSALILLVAFKVSRGDWEAVSVWYWTKVALGLGLIIFIHELGHFLVAKWCNVHVETFSIGFGPALPGCSFRWGETTYKLALIPLGGYVKMMGQVDGDESDDPETDDNPRSYRNKTVGQRMAIISAGVFLNVLLAFVLFGIAYTGGVKRKTAIVDVVEPGSPAWHGGLHTGMVFEQIGPVRQPSFEDLTMEVALSSQGQKVPMVLSLPGVSEAPLRLELEPRLGKEDSRPRIGVSPPFELRLRQDLPKDMPHPVVPGSAAAQAEPPLLPGDRIVAMSDPATPDRVTALPPDPRGAEDDRRDYFEYRRRMQLLAGQPVVVRVQRQAGEEVDVRIPPAFHVTLGLRMRAGPVAALRDGSPAAQAGVRPGDILQELVLTTGQGERRRFALFPRKGESAPEAPDLIDPLRLPDAVRDWLADRTEVRIAFAVFRDNPHKHIAQELVELGPVLFEAPADWRFHREIPLDIASPLAIPGLGLAYHVEAVVNGEPVPGSPAHRAGLADGDVVKAVRFGNLDPKTGLVRPGSWREIDSHHWAYVFRLLQEEDCKQLSLRVQSKQQLREVELTAEPDPTWPRDERGLLFEQDERIRRATGIAQAIAMGLHDTTNSIIKIYLGLKNMLTGRLPASKNLHGPIYIGAAAYAYASMDLSDFLAFLGMISVNLAVINFLPIPVLDGGHMVFLAYEWLRGKPAPEGVRVAATWIGLLLIASLMLFAIYRDIFVIFWR